MERFKIRKKISVFLAACILLALFEGGSLSAFAASAAVSGFDDVSTVNVPKSGSITPVKLDDDVTLTSSGGFSDGYLLIHNTSSAVTGDVLSLLSDSSTSAYGAISLTDGIVYLGSGSGKKQIGSIDETLNGVDGKDLKILFATPLPNGGFEDGSDNWTYTNSIISLSGDSGKTSGSTTTEVKTKNPYFNWNWVEPSDGSSSYMRLYISAWLTKPYGTLHGPKITSKAFAASNGEYVSLNYYAKNTGDKFDVYGYITDTVTGAKQQLFYQRGDETDGWQKISTKITLPNSSNFVFEFLCGSQDGTGGQYISSELLVDNVRVISDLVNAQVVTNVARRVAFVGASQATRTSTQNRTYSLTVADANGNLYNAAGPATVKVHTYPATPVVNATAVLGTLDSLAITWSAVDAVTYNVYRDDSLISNGTSSTSSTINGLATNKPYVIKVIGINDMGESAAYSKTAYTNAAVPTLTATAASSGYVELSVGNNGNPTGTAYCIERSTTGTGGWTIVNNFALTSSAGDSTAYIDTGLAPNTTYYYRIKARNGDSVATTYSNTASRLTAPAAPNPIAVTGKSNTSDSLFVTWAAPGGAISYDINIGGAVAAANVLATADTCAGLVPNTAYEVYVTAKNAGGNSLISDKIVRYTLAAIPSLTVDEVTTSQIKLAIAGHDNPIGTPYRLEQSVDGINWTPIENYTLSALAGNLMTYTVTGLGSGTTYHYRIAAKNGDNLETAYSEAVSKQTLPSAPTGLQVIPGEDTDDTLSVTWTAPVGADSYDIYRKGIGESNFSLLESTYTGTLLMDSGLTSNRQYTYYIIARNDSGVSAASTQASKYTLAALPDIASINSGDTNNLTITANGNPLFGADENPSGTTYLIQYSTDDGTTWNDLRDWITYLTPQHSSVTSGLTYAYHVKAKNGDGVETEYSGASSARSNIAPEITFTAPLMNVYRSAISPYTTFTLSGTVKDADSDVVKITAAINGKTKTIYVNATPEGVNWSLTWNIFTDNIAESTYNSITVTGDDDFNAGSTSAVWPYLLYVDRTGPQQPAINTNTDWTNAAAVVVAITPGTDLVAGVDKTQYKLSGATSLDWTTYSGQFSINNAGQTTISSRTVDAIGNIGAEQIAVVKIDRAAPTGISAKITSTAGSDDFTNSSIVDITNISAADAGGSGNGAGEAGLPKEMQLSNSADFTDAIWEAYATSRANWNLTAANGTKTVYIRYKDAVGNVSAAASCTIVFDNGSPVVSISSPSRFNAKKGMTVTYEIEISEACTLTGISNGDSSNIMLATAGTFTAGDINAIIAAITVTEVDATHRIININIPGSINSEGTIGIKVLAGAAEDSAGNVSVDAIGNASFVIDAVSPNNQNVLFAAPVTTRGGQAVTLAATSESCAGGYDSDSVRFASAGYDGTQPANGKMITSTHGRSTVINAPTEDGIYYLYVIDAAGNISAASLEALTVKNDGPSLSISEPSDAYVNKGSAVDYIVTYSADATVVTLTSSNIALVTTGTANAYVGISDVAGQPLQKKVTLSNLMGEGEVRIRVSAGSAVDAQGNLALASSVSAAVNVDNTAPAVDAVTFISNNASHTTYAHKSDTVTLAIHANEALSGITGTIAGQNVVFTKLDGSATAWQASLTLPNDNTLDAFDGQELPFAAVMTDLTGNVSPAITETSDDEGVTYDISKPVLTLTGGKDSLGHYAEGVTVSFNEGTAELTNTDTSESTAILSGGVVYDQGAYSLTVKDLAGNSETVTFVVSYDATVLTQDIAALEIGYAEGDYAQSVTQNITLPQLSGSGAAVNWEVVSGAGVVLSGDVTRPPYSDGDDDETVVLKATITIDGLSDTKTFTLNIRGLQDDTNGLGNVKDDAELAQIRYAYGDLQNSVTDDIYLGDTGLLHASILSWTSDNSAIQIAPTSAGGEFTATVTRPEIGGNDVTVVLTVTATDKAASEKTTTYNYTLVVKALELTDGEKANIDYDVVNVVYAAGDSETSVKQNLVFVANVLKGSTVTWKTSDESCVSNNGAVKRPAHDAGNKDVTITATITNGEATVTKRFTVTVIREELTAGESLTKDFDNLEIGYYGSDSDLSVTTHVTLPLKGREGSVITWESSDESVIADGGTVTRKAQDKQVTLTATLLNGAETLTKVFNLTVKETNEDDILQQILDDTTALALVYAEGDEQSFVTENLMLRNIGANGSTIEWQSSMNSVVGTDGTVTKQAVDVTVTLTATVKKYSDEIGYFVNRTKTFTVVVAKKGYLDVDSDMDDIDIIYATGDSASSVTSSVYLAKTGATGCTISWVSSNAGMITSFGKVTRPGPEEADHAVTLTATILNPVSGETSTKIFELTVKKMTDEDAVKFAAKALTSDLAFSFGNSGDIWESVTEQFLMLTSGAYDTTITWGSSNEAVISFGGIDADTGKQLAQVIRPIAEDVNVILTATFTLNDATTTKAYLMVVKATAASKTGTREKMSGIVFDLTTGTGAGQLPAFRTTVTEGGETSYIDTVIFEPGIIEGLTEAVDPNGTEENRTFGLSMPATGAAETQTDEQAIEVSSVCVGSMADHNMRLAIESPFAGVLLDENSMRTLANTGTDLYFRIVPIKDLEQRGAFETAIVTQTGDAVTFIGTPVMIETNYTDINTYIILPFNGAVIEDYNNISIYIRHSDGTKELIKGTLVYNEGSDVPYGVQFLITHFSEFQLLEMPSAASGASTSEQKVFSGDEIDKQLDENGKITIIGDGASAEIKKGDINTAEIAGKFGTGVDSKDVVFTFTLEQQKAPGLEKTKELLAKAGLVLAGTPITFGLTAEYGASVLTVDTFKSYVTLLIPLADGQKITTAVRVGEDGRIIHIPTEVTRINDKYYAKINSLVSGTFALIWNPTEMKDVANHWSKDDVNDMASRLVAEGTGGQNYEPLRNVTRAEFAAILVRGLGLLPGVGEQSFTDVNQDAWYAEYIETAAEYGLIYGYGDTTFGPNDTITREQAMAMISRAMKLTGLNPAISENTYTEIFGAFTDSDTLSDYAKAPAALCINSGIILGVGNETLLPKAAVTRAETAAIIRRLLQKSEMID